MEKYIDIDTLIDYIDWDNDLQKWTLRKDPEDIPAADVERVIHAEWVKPENGIYRCSNCGTVCPYDVQGDIFYYWDCPRCPKCGAVMNI